MTNRMTRDGTATYLQGEESEALWDGLSEIFAEYVLFNHIYPPQTIFYRSARQPSASISGYAVGRR